MKKILTILAMLVLAACDNSEDTIIYEAVDIDASSAFFSAGANDWRYDANTDAWFFTFNTGLINDITVDVGAVLVYVADLESQENRWRALPRTEIYYTETGEFDYSIEWGYWFGPGYVEIEIYHTNPDPITWPDINADFKLVVLDDFASQNLRERDVDLNNYQEVESALKDISDENIHENR